MWSMPKLFYLCATASVAFSKNSVEVNVVPTEGNAIVDEEITTEKITTSTSSVTSGDSHYVECPPAFDGYCLHGGTCLYLPDHPDPNQRPLCRCTPDYVGTRCQVGNVHTRRGMAAGPRSTTDYSVTIAAVAGVLSVVVLLGAAFLGWSCLLHKAISIANCSTVLRVYLWRKAGYDAQTSGVSEDKTGYGSTTALN